MTERGIIIVIAFAAGVLVRDIAQDWRDQAPKAQPTRTQAPEPVHRPPRESWVLTHPLTCDGMQVIMCSDWKPCRTTCLPARVDDPRALGLKPKGNLQDLPQRVPQPPLILRASE